MQTAIKPDDRALLTNKEDLHNRRTKALHNNPKIIALNIQKSDYL